MKLRNLLYATFAMTMVACSQENSFLSQDETGVLRTISSGSGKFASRSVVDSKWEQNDAIGVFMLKSDASSTYAENVKFTNNTAEANTKVTFTSETGITLVNDKVKFHAYYPWSDTNVTGTTYNVQISDQTELTAVSNSDLRWAVSDEKDLTNGTLEGGLSLNFAHKLTFLKVKTNVADVKSVSVSGVNTEAQFNIVDGTLSNEAGNTKSIQLCETTIKGQTVYCGIVVPTTELKDFVIKIVATEEGKDMVYQYVYGDNTTLAEGFKGGWQYLFNITLEGSTGSATLDEIEAELGGFEGDDTPVNGEVSDPQEAVTDITVPAGTDLNGLKALLADKIGKVSLNFADGTYDLSGKGSVEEVGRVGLEFPEAITGISFVGSDPSKVILNIAYLRWPGDLQELKFKNVKVESNGSDYFIYTHIPVDENGDLIADYEPEKEYAGEKKPERVCRFAEGGVIEINGCYFHNTKRIFRWSTDNGASVTNNKLSSFSIVNSRMEGTNESLFEKFESANIVIKNSTVYNWSNIAVAGNSDAVYDVQNCTFAKVSASMLEGGSSITFNNNIVADIQKSIIWSMTLTEAVNNYASTGTNLGNKLEEGKNITSKELSELLPDYSGGDLSTMFVPASEIEAGDPRW